MPKKKTKPDTANDLSTEGIRLMLKQPNSGTESGQRDMVLLSLMYDFGARVQEMADLAVGDFRGGGLLRR
jgi:site-specific recombinase XerD